MTTYIALFRGINVGGRNMLPMKDLKLLLEAEGCTDVKTYIQSGNAILRTKLTDSGRLAKRITAAVAKGHGFEPRVLLRSVSDLESAIRANPFPEADAQPKSLHLFFLDAIPKSADWTGFDAIKTKTERFKLVGDVLYLYTPDGFGISKLAAKAEKLLGVAATARNWRTVTTLHEMASQY